MSESPNIEDREAQGSESGSKSEQGRPGTLGIREILERAFLAGIGAAALTKDRLQELAEDLVRRGQLSKDEGRDTVEKLLTRSREEAQTLLKKADSSLHGVYKELGLVTREEFEELMLQVRQLELRLQRLEEATGSGISSGEGRPDQNQSTG
ncbi:MAG: hypothetical protein N3B14_05635 [Thermoleophilia bacterium]|nr:hypothetical protein [Thermoleophilia bacterium]